MLAQHMHRGLRPVRLPPPTSAPPRRGKEGLGGRSCSALARKSLPGRGWWAQARPRPSGCARAVTSVLPGSVPAQASAAVPDPGGVVQRCAAAPRRLRGSLPQVSLAGGGAGAGPSTAQSPAGAWGAGGSLWSGWDSAPILPLCLHRLSHRVRCRHPRVLLALHGVWVGPAHLRQDQVLRGQECPLPSSPHGREGADPALRGPGTARPSLVLRSKSPKQPPAFTGLLQPPHRCLGLARPQVQSGGTPRCDPQSCPGELTAGWSEGSPLHWAGSPQHGCCPLWGTWGLLGTAPQDSPCPGVLSSKPSLGYDPWSTHLSPPCPVWDTLYASKKYF